MVETAPEYTMIERKTRRVIDYIKSFLQELWINRVSVVGLIVIYVAIWKSDQGMDLLLNLNSDQFGVAIFYVMISVLAILNWYLGRYYKDRNYHRPGNTVLGIPNPNIVGHIHFIKRI